MSDPGTHTERVLRLLSDGRPHSHTEGYRLNVMLHSRVADLRKKGYTITCWREGDVYLYQLTGSLEEVASAAAASSSEPGNLEDPTRRHHPGPPEPEQLDLLAELVA